MAEGRLPGFLFGRPRRRFAIHGENTARPPQLRGRVFLQDPIPHVTQASLKPSDSQALDALTGGAFSAPTAGERAARVREWLQADPSPEQMQEVYRELSGRDKGAAKLLRERLDEIKRSKGQ